MYMEELHNLYSSTNVVMVIMLHF